MIISKRGKAEGEKGEIMLEGIIILTVTMFVLFWLIGLSFMYYERYILTIITNDAAKKISATYNYPTSDIIMGYVTPYTVVTKDTYRHFFIGETGRTNKLNVYNDNKVESYVKYMLDITNFPGSIENVDVTLETTADTCLRKHITLKTSCEFWTPLGGVFDFFGMGRTQEFEVTAYAEVADYYEYMTTTQYSKNLSHLFDGSGSFLSSLVNMLNTFVEMYNHDWS